MPKYLLTWRHPLTIIAMGAGLLLGAFTYIGHGWLGFSVILLAFALISATFVAVRAQKDYAASTPRKAIIWVVGVFFATTSLLLTILIPPLQSPDERAHLSRAYSLWENDVFMRQVTDRSNSQDIDQGLQTYMVSWGGIPYRPDVQVERRTMQKSQEIKWFNKSEWIYNPAAPYFPALYAPAAVGLGMAKTIDQPPWVAASWARILMWGTGVIATILALLIVQSGFRLMCAVVLFPMTMAQIGSSNLDATTIPLAFLMLALYSWSAMALAGNKHTHYRPEMKYVEFSSWIILGLLALAKPVFLAFLLWPMYRAIRERSVGQAIGVGIVFLLAGLWQWDVTSSGFVHPNTSVHEPPLARLRDAALSPIDMISMLTRTFAEKSQFYWESMVGILGWLDTPLGQGLYISTWALLTAAIIGDILSRNIIPVSARLVLLLIGAAYVVGCMLLLWVTWTPSSSPVVEGISGRYFLPLLPVVAFGFGGTRWSVASIRYDWILLFLFGLYEVTLVIDLATTLVARYWL